MILDKKSKYRLISSGVALLGSLLAIIFFAFPFATYKGTYNSNLTGYYFAFTFKNQGFIFTLFPILMVFLILIASVSQFSLLFLYRTQKIDYKFNPMKNSLSIYYAIGIMIFTVLAAIFIFCTVNLNDLTMACDLGWGAILAGILVLIGGSALAFNRAIPFILKE